MPRQIRYRVYGDRALFADPVTRIGGEKSTYLVPTYQALKGITESVYWKPTFIWKIKSVKIVNQIRTETVGIRPAKYNKAAANDLSYYTYLKDVCYEVVAEFEWNANRSDLEDDRNERKHLEMANRAIKKGGRRDIFLGARECQGYVEMCEESGEKSAYEEREEIDFGFMFHSFVYPDEAFDSSSYGYLTKCFDRYVMKNGVIEFNDPSKILDKVTIKEMEMKTFKIGDNLSVVRG